MKSYKQQVRELEQELAEKEKQRRGQQRRAQRDTRARCSRCGTVLPVHGHHTCSTTSDRGRPSCADPQASLRAGTPVIPPMAINDTLTRVLGAVIDLHATEGRATVRSLAARIGRSASTTHYHLERLSQLGLIDGLRSGAHGSIRPTVVVVAADPEAHR